MLKLNISKGRKELKPSEVLTFLPGGVDVQTLLSDLIRDVSRSCPSVSAEFTTSLSCNDCSEKLFGRDGDNCFIDLKSHKLNEDLSILVNQCEMDQLTAHQNCNAEILHLPDDSSVLFLRSDIGLKLRLTKPVKFFGKSLRCVAVITATTQYFSSHGVWYEVYNNVIIEVSKDEVDVLENVLLVSLETVSEDDSTDQETLTYSGSDYQRIIKLGDRHRDTPQRREDRHTDQADRHLDPADRHLDTPQRKQDRHLDKSFRGQSKTLQKVKKDIYEDTGMEVKCCSCLELKSRRSCVYRKNLSEELMNKYCYRHEITRSLDGDFYVCLTCHNNIKADKEPSRAGKTIYGLLDIPQGEFIIIYCFTDIMQNFLFTGFKTQLEERIVRNPYADEISKPYTQLNRLEHSLLKTVIPFMKIGHCPRGSYFHLKGSVVMISADVTSTLEKILPVGQNLIPVSFKRKLEYKGHYLREYIDRDKLALYFRFFKTNNHLYEDLELGDLEKFEEKMSSAADDHAVDEEDGQSEEPALEPAVIPMSQSSLILDKYQEPVNVQTYANKYGSMIYELEQFHNLTNEEEVEEPGVIDPEENCFPEDEIEESEEENVFLDMLHSIDVKLEEKEDLAIISELEEMFQSWKKKPRLHLVDHFCSLAKKQAHFVSQKDQLLRLKSNNTKLQELINLALNDVSESITETSEKLNQTNQCCHDYDDVTDKLLDQILNYNADKESSSDQTNKFVRSQLKQIEKNLQYIISVAPAEQGSFQSWGSDLFLEEKLFPHLFPYGIGGFLSSNLIKGKNMGFANYCKNRILSILPKYREDVEYIFFLTIVKEQLQMRRSERTFFRKASKVPSLTAAALSGISPEMLQRSNSLYNSLRDLRGSACYFQDSKKKLMAFLRQKGAPTLFVTLSAAEFAWDDLALRTYETVTNKRSTLEFIRSQSQSWRNKLIQSNVVQSTIHFSKRIEKIISYLKNNPLLEHDGVQYTVDAYFVREEFQVSFVVNL